MSTILFCVSSTLLRWRRASRGNSPWIAVFWGFFFWGGIIGTGRQTSDVGSDPRPLPLQNRRSSLVYFFCLWSSECYEQQTFLVLTALISDLRVPCLKVFFSDKLEVRWTQTQQHFQIFFPPTDKPSISKWNIFFVNFPMSNCTRALIGILIPIQNNGKWVQVYNGRWCLFACFFFQSGDFFCHLYFQHWTQIKCASASTDCELSTSTI